ncbi:MAG: AMP-binding protein, partial [Clostridium sp.]
MKLGKHRLAERLESVCNKYKETVAIIYARDNGNREEYTFGEIKKNAEELVNKIASIGIKSGNRIGIVGANSPWWITALFASLKGETTAVLIDASLPSDEIDRLIKNSDLSCLFIYEEIFDALNKEDYKNLPVYSLDKGYNLINDCRVNKEIADIDEDVFAIIYSSGTTSS